MSKSIKLSEPDWATLHDRIKQDYPKSVWLVRDKMRRVLGFVPREHKEWHPYDPKTMIKDHWWGHGPTITIYLDFYDEGKKTFFLLKYSEYINGKER